MATSVAPSGTVWGSTVDNYGRLGLYVSKSVRKTQVDVTVQIWFWSKYAATDANNSLYFNDNASSATSLVTSGKQSIATIVNSGAWSTYNQQLVYTWTKTFDRTSAAQTRNCAAKLTGVEIVTGTMTVSTSYTIDALPSYTITYRDNGFTLTNTLPANQTKLHGESIKLSSHEPTTVGYTCVGWITGLPEGKTYDFGETYSDDASLVLYAQWVSNKYDVVCYENYGSNKSTTYEKTHGVSLVLPKLTRTNYNFLGWSTSSTATSAQYAPGVSYTENTGVTLYAVWEAAYMPPSIANITVSRCDANGYSTDEGTYINVSFEWATDKNLPAEGRQVTIGAADPNNVSVDLTDTGTEEFNISGSSGTFNKTIGLAVGGPFNTEYSYTIDISVGDTAGNSTTICRSIMPIAYPIDILAEGKGVSFGKPAKTAGILDSAWPIYEEGKRLSEKYAPGYTKGTSGASPDIIWSYTKWSDGRVDLWGTYVISNMECGTALGSWYRTDVFSPGDFPFDVYNPRLVANYESTGYGALLWATTVTTTTATPSYYLIRPTSTTIVSGKIIFYVTGRWT